MVCKSTIYPDFVGFKPTKVVISWGWTIKKWWLHGISTIDLYNFFTGGSWYAISTIKHRQVAIGVKEPPDGWLAWSINKETLRTICSGVSWGYYAGYIFWGHSGMYNLYNQRQWSGQPLANPLQMVLNCGDKRGIYEGRWRVFGLGVWNSNNHYFAALLSTEWRGHLWMPRGSFKSDGHCWFYTYIESK